MSSVIPGSDHLQKPYQVPAGHLTCTHCGHTFAAPAWPRIRCPQCGTLGHPDRAGAHLLGLHWSCFTCGSWNDGSLNFCTTCGAGLGTICRNCEAPLHRAMCDRCGAHQDRIRRYEAAEASHISWRPILQEQVQEPKPDPEPDLSASRQQAAARKQPRINRWGLLWIVVGIVLLAVTNGTLVAQWMGFESTEALGVFFQGRMEAAFFSIATLTPSNPIFGYLLVTGLVMLALLPVMLLLIKRLADRIFPE